MTVYSEIKPDHITLTDSVTAALKTIKAHDDHVFLETPSGTYIQQIDNILQGNDTDKPAAGTQGRWYYAIDTGFLYYDDGSNWNKISPKVKEIDISTTCGSVAITGLDFNKHKKIQIYGSIYNPSANISTISLCCNGDTVLTNYYSQSIYADGTDIGSGRHNDGRCLYLKAGKCGMFNAMVSFDYNNIFRAISEISIVDPSSVQYSVYAIAGSASVTNITELDLVSDQSDGIGDGSKIYVKQG